MKNRGFTLIELLVVIAVIGILASVVLASLNSARAKGRNARRASDVKQIMLAFQMAINDTGTVPSVAAEHCISATCYESWANYVRNSTVDAWLAPYLPTWPSDPVGGRARGGYLYFLNFPGGTTPYDGSPAPAGHIINWATEPPLSSTSCSGGKVWNVESNFVECVLYIN